jgi:UDP-2,3-diacylglucosamine pyrophosphatase LpxH
MTAPFKIQYVSDIHLETRYGQKFYDILKPEAPYLALCGDIGNFSSSLYEPFIEYCSKSFEHVFYVAGNHEFYNSKVSISKYMAMINLNTITDLTRLKMQEQIITIEETLERISKLCDRFPNVHFLNKSVYQVPSTDYYIVGCTLWSNIDMDIYTLIQFNDFKKIMETKTKPLTPGVYKQMHNNHKQFLEDTISNLSSANENAKILVLTHHCPTFKVIDDKYLTEDNHEINTFFATDLEYLLRNNVKAWICGHTHGCKQVNINNTIVATNTYGYLNETISRFSNKAIIEI